MAKIGSIIQEQRKKQEAYQEKRAAGYTKLGASRETYVSAPDPAQRLTDLMQARARTTPSSDPMDPQPWRSGNGSGFDLAKFLTGTGAKGANAIAKQGSSALSFLERNTVGAGLGLLTGDREIYKSLPFYQLNEGVSRDAEALGRAFDANTAAGGKAAQIAESIGVGTIAAIPQALVAMATAGGSMAAQGLEAASAAAQASPTLARTLQGAAGQMAKSPNYWTSFFSTVGNSYESAKADGADDTRAALYALADSLIGSVVEVSGGIQTLPGELRGGRFTVRKWIDTMLDEGKEEVVQGVLSRGLENTVYGKGNPIASLRDGNAMFNPGTMASEFGMGAAVGGILGGAQGLLGNAAAPRGETVSQEAALTGSEALAREAGQRAGTENRAQEAVEAPRGDFLTEQLFGREKAASQGETASTAVDDNPTVHTPVEQATIEAYKRAADSGLVNFVKNAVANKGSNKGRYDLKPVDSRACEDIKALTGVDASGFSTAMESRMAEHIVRDHGPEGLTDHSMADLNDIGRIQYVLDHYDSMEHGGSSSAYVTNKPGGGVRQAQTVVYKKAVNGTYYVVEAVPETKRKTVFVVSAYMEKAKGAPQTADAKAPAYTPKSGNEAVTFADTSIPASGENVNDGLGAADAGFSTAGLEGTEQTSRTLDTSLHEATGREGTGMSPEAYREMFRYQSQTEGMTQHLAQEALYLMRDGKETFIRDIDEAAYQGIVDSLKAAEVWSAEQVDAAHMIKTELQGRSISGEIAQEELVDWVDTMRQRATAGGQGVQAWSKWSREGNEGGYRTEAEAWDNLKSSSLSNEEKQRIFRDIVVWDSQIEAVRSGDAAALKDIILQVAKERGTLDGLTGRQSRTLTALAEKSLDSMDFDQLKSMAYASTSALSTDSTPANLGQKIKTIQVLNMLSSPKTAAKNLVGNTTFYGLDALSMKGAAILDMALSRVTGTRSVAFERGALSPASMKDAARAMRMAVAEITLDVDMDGGKSRYGTSSKRTFRAGGGFLERVLSACERNMAYLLNATDEFYKGAARGTAERTQALVDQGKIRTDNSHYAQEQAEALAKYRTFQDDSKISDLIQTIHDGLNMLVGVGDSGRKTRSGNAVHAFGAGDIVAPFTRVAGNLASRGLEYSPLNAAKGAVEIVDAVVRSAGGRQADPARQAKGVSNLARGMTGTAIAYGFMQLAKAGLLRQAEDEDDEDVRALNAAEGISGTQFNLDAAKRLLSGAGSAWKAGDTLVDLGSIEPLNLLMNLGTEMAKDGGNPIAASFRAAPESFLDATAELPVMQFVGNSATDIIRYNQDPKEVLVREAANTAAASLLPNLLRSAARGLDDRPRSTYAGDSLAENMRDNVKNSIPGLRQTLPGSVDPFGRDRTYQGGRADILLNAVLNPVGVSTYTQDDISRELERVRGKTGDASFYPDKSAPSKLSGDGREVSLSYAQRQDFQKVRGSTALVTMGQMLGSSAYKSASSEAKAELLSACNDYAYQVAKAGVLGSGSVDSWVLNAKNARRELGVSTAEYIALYQKYGGNLMSGSGYEKTREAVKAGLTVEEYAEYKGSVSGLTADKDANGTSISGSKKEKVIAAIDAQDLSPTEKDWLYLLNYDGKNAQKDLRGMPWNR